MMGTILEYLKYLDFLTVTHAGLDTPVEVYIEAEARGNLVRDSALDFVVHLPIFSNPPKHRMKSALQVP